jgi:hypothetical protein
MDISAWIKPLGIVTYVFVILTFLVGMFRARLKLKPKHHKLLAWLAVILASLHGALVLVFY